MNSKKLIISLIVAIAMIGLAVSLSGCTGDNTATPTPTAVASATPAPAPQKLMIATTTSMDDTKLLPYLIEDFEKENNVDVDYTAVGSGQALKLGESGDVDLLIVHSPKDEQKFIEAGHGWNRTQFAHNFFIVVGPASDPAGVKGMDNATKAFEKIARTESNFISRGDLSGTHKKELEIWNASSVARPTNKSSWYIETGVGQAQSLRMADEKQAYMLSDMSTYLNNQKNLSLIVMVEGDPSLINKYNLIAINKTEHPHVNYDMAKKFIDYMTSQETQQKISVYGQEKFGRPLFYADLLNQTAQ